MPTWAAVRTTRWLYVAYRATAASQQRNTLRRLLGDLRRCRGRSCDKLASASVR